MFSFQFKGHVVNQLTEVLSLLFENYDTFKEYMVDEFMSSSGLTVDPKYRGRGIGTQFLASRLVCHIHFLPLFRKPIQSVI